MTDTPQRPGTLHCVPTPIAAGRTAITDLPAPAARVLCGVDYVIAESAKTARAVLKPLPLVRPIQSIEIVELNEHTRDDAIGPMLAPLLAGRDAALVSEAGCPGGPSALLLALMGSGLDGQRFAFAGYLPTAPVARAQRLKALEQRSAREHETQLFIETPYRNQVMLQALLDTLAPSTLMCVAADLTGIGQSLTTDRVDAWRRRTPTLARVPTVFLFLAA